MKVSWLTADGDALLEMSLKLSRSPEGELKPGPAGYHVATRLQHVWGVHRGV